VFQYDSRFIPKLACVILHAGFALSGFATGEAPGAERSTLLAAVLKHLPADKLRYMPGMVRAMLIVGGLGWAAL
jgi:queuine/archaeosine tRNA-ribosyltransferase